MDPFDLSVPVSFSRPGYLWLLAAGLGLVWWLGRGGMAGLEGRRAVWALWLRLVVVALLGLALSGLRIEWRSRDLAVVFLVDRSDSVSGGEVERALGYINQALALKRPSDQAGVVVFGEDALVEREPGVAVARIDRLLSAPSSTGYTNIARALRLGLGLFPPGVQRRMVLLTDGNENIGSALTEAALAAGREVPIDVVVLQPSTADEVLVENVAVPERLDRNKPFDVRVSVLATRAGPATLRLFRNRSLVGQSEVELTPGKNVFLFPQTESEGGYNTYEAVVDAPADTVRDNNAAVAYALVEGEPRVLLVGAPEDTATLAQALRQQNIPADTAEAEPARAADLERYGALYLVNRSAEQLAPGTMRLLRDWAGELGGGLGMIGGPDTFGLGGWGGTPVEEALPVSMELKDKRQFPSLGMVILLDKSGSMAGGLPNSNLTKLELAVEGAVKAIYNLTPSDWVGVIGFDSAAKWDVPWQKVANPAAMAEQVRTLRPGGGTDAIPAFEEAIKVFNSTPLQHRHVVFLTDGIVQPGDYDSVTRRLNALGVTVTAIGVGSDTDVNFLTDLAFRNNGRFYFTDDPNRLPQIFVKETVLAQKAYLIEEPFTPSLTAASQIMRGLGALPALKGYVNAEAKERAEVVLRTQREDPLLAIWRHRAGKGLAWTSDARDRWAADWIGWNGYRQFWEQATRWLLRERKPSTLQPRVTVENGEGIVRVEAVTEEGDFQNLLALEARVLTPDNEVRRVALRQTGAGQYEGRFEARATGSYLASVGGEGVEPATAGTSLSYPPEYRTSRPNGLLLNQIAAMTGGRIDGPAAEVFRPAEKRVESRLDLWQALLWAAVALWLADIAARRLTFDEEQRRQIAAIFAPLTRVLAAADRLVGAGPRADRAAAASATLGALHARRANVRAGLDLRRNDTAPATPSELFDQIHSSVGSSPANAGSDKTGAKVAQSGKPGASAPDVPQAPVSAQEEEADRFARLMEARRKARIKRGDD